MSLYVNIKGSSKLWAIMDKGIMTSITLVSENCFATNICIECFMSLNKNQNIIKIPIIPHVISTCKIELWVCP